MTGPQIFVICYFVVWIVCGIFSYGAELAYEVKEFEKHAELSWITYTEEHIKRSYRNARLMAWVAALTGYMSLPLNVLYTDHFRHGFMWSLKRHLDLKKIDKILGS